MTLGDKQFLDRAGYNLEKDGACYSLWFGPVLLGHFTCEDHAVTRALELEDWKVGEFTRSM